MQRPNLRINPNVVQNEQQQQTPDTQNNPDNDPLRLLKLSHSLRYQLAQPLKRQPPEPPFVHQNFQQQDPPLYPPGAASPHSPQGWQSQSGGQPLAAHFPTAQHVANPELLAQMLQSQQQLQQHMVVMAMSQPQLAPLKGPGTKSGPYSGFASKDWLQAEIRQEVDTLRKHVDAYVTQREQRAFDVERSAMQAEISHLRTRVAEADDKVVKLELMLPNDKGEFRALRAELNELEKEADYFGGLYEREVAATKAALGGFRQALADMTEIEQEFERIQRIIATIPEAATHGAGVGAGPVGGSQVGTGGAGAARPGGSPPVVEPRGWCGCLPSRRR